MNRWIVGLAASAESVVDECQPGESPDLLRFKLHLLQGGFRLALPEQDPPDVHVPTHSARIEL